MNNYEFVLADDEADAIVTELEQQEVRFQQAFYLFVEKTVSYGWDRGEREELIDRQVETYLMTLVLGDSRRLMLSRSASSNQYTYLGLTRDPDPGAMEAVYRRACQAHQLSGRLREP